MRRILRGLVTALILGLLTAQMAAANGTPILVKLAYLPGISNYTPAQAATGEAKLVMVEGDVKVTVQGLPRLVNDRYEVFLTNSETGASVSVGKFNSPEQGTAGLQSVVDNLAAGRFNLAVITVEPEPDPSPAPDSRIALAGRFEPPPPATPIAGLPAAIGTPVGPMIPSATGESIPITLPRTGWPAALNLGLLAGAAGVAIAAGWLAGRRR